MPSNKNKAPVSGLKDYRPELLRFSCSTSAFSCCSSAWSFVIDSWSTVWSEINNRLSTADLEAKQTCAVTRSDIDVKIISKAKSQR